MSARSASIFPAWLLRVLVLAGVYFVVARLSLLLAFENTNASPVWPPSGIAFAIILFLGYRTWPAVAIGAFLANAVVFSLNQATASPWPVLAISILIALGNSLEALVAVYLLRNALGRNNPLDRPIYLFRFLLIVPVAALFASVVGALSICSFRLITWDYYHLVWFTWWLGDVAGILILSTLFLPWYRGRPKPLDRLQKIEAVFFLIVAYFIGFMVFGSPTHTGIDNVPLANLFIPLVVWAVFRLGEIGLGITVLVFMSTTVWGTINGFGPFVKDSLNESLLLLEGFVGVITLTGLVLMAALRENRQAQAAVADREEWFRALIENSHDILTLIDERGKVVYSSPSTSRVLGHKIKDYVGRVIFDFIHPEDIEPIMKQFRRVLERDGNFVAAECRFRHADGSWVWLEGSGINLINEKTIRSIVINCREITERKNAFLAQARLALIVDSTSDAIISKSLDGVVTSWNHGAEELYGFSADEMIGQSVLKIIPGDKIQEFRSVLERLARGENIEHLETVRRSRSGSFIDVSVSISVLRDNEGRIIGASTISRDVTEHKRAELRRQYIVEAAMDAVVSIDAEGRIIEWNRQAELIFGYAREEIFGKKLSETIIPRAHRQAHEQGMKHYFKTGVGPVLNRRIEISALNRSGKEFPVELSIIPIHMKDSVIFSGFLRDITQRKRAEEQLKRYAQDLKESNESLEDFAFVASHDLQEPLRIVSSYVQLFAKRFKESIDPDLQKYVGYIVDNVSRMQEMISGLLEYSRIGRADTKYYELDSSRACDRAIANLDFVIKKRKAAVSRDDLPVVRSNDTELTRLFQNLIGNALKYCESVPAIHIGSSDENDYWLFCVKDNGIGIDAAYLEQIFDVFKRLHSKSEYPGTGMGLSICKKIVEKLGGKIWVESKLGEGSAFYFTLPKKNET